MRKLFDHEIIRYISSPSCYLKRAALLILVYVHEYTKFCTARTIWELFYWPDGICLDMAVILAFFLIAGMCAYDDMKFFKNYFRDDDDEKYFDSDD